MSTIKNVIIVERRVNMLPNEKAEGIQNNERTEHLLGLKLREEQGGHPASVEIDSTPGFPGKKHHNRRGEGVSPSGRVNQAPSR